MAVKVIKPGLSTTVQDLGRPGYYHIGIPLSGGMDRLALKAANWLAGMVGSLPRLHELAQQAGIELPPALGKLKNTTGDGMVEDRVKL